MRSGFLELTVFTATVGKSVGMCGSLDWCVLIDIFFPQGEQALTRLRPWVQNMGMAEPREGSWRTMFLSPLMDGIISLAQSLIRSPASRDLPSGLYDSNSVGS